MGNTTNAKPIQGLTILSVAEALDLPTNSVVLRDRRPDLVLVLGVAPALETETYDAVHRAM